MPDVTFFMLGALCAAIIAWIKWPEPRDKQYVQEAPDLENFWDRHARWSTGILGTPEPGPIGTLRHLHKEVAECLEKPYDLEEYADLMHLVFQATRLAGFSYGDLVAACFFKLAKNEHRQWGKPSSDKPVEHVR